MKKIIKLIVIALIVTSCSSKKNTTSNGLIISQEIIKKDGIAFVLKSIVNDSRCPKGVECITAGDVEAVVSVYNNNVLVEESNLVFSSQNKEINSDWFSKYTSLKIESIQVLPYPKEGKKTNPKEYFIKIN
jgi:hypothetical protein